MSDQDGDGKARDGMSRSELADMQRAGDIEGLCKTVRTCPDWKLRYDAVRLLGELRDADATPSLAHALSDGSGKVRWAAAEALGLIGDARAIPALVSALTDDWAEYDDTGFAASQVVSTTAQDALVAIGASAVEAVAAGAANCELGHARRITAISLLGRIGGGESAGVLVPILGDRAARIRSAAATALGETGYTGSSDPLLALLDDEDESVREAAAKSLRKLGREPNDPSQRAAIAVALREWEAARSEGGAATASLVAALSESTDREVREQAARALRRLRDPNSVGPLIKALRDECADVRKWSAKALGAIGVSEAVEPLRSLLSDEDDRAKKAAQEALGEIQGS